MPRTIPGQARREKDAALAVEAIARPEAAIAATWRRFAPLVRWTLMKILGPDEDVRDLTQDAFVQLQRSVRALRSPESIRPFVTGLAIRVALREMRRRRVREGQVLVPGQGLVPLASTSADTDAREAMAHLVRVVSRLRPADRQMFRLRQLQGLDQQEICNTTGLSISTVRRRLRHLERRLEIQFRADPLLAPYAHRADTSRTA